MPTEQDRRWNLLRDTGGGGVSADSDLTAPANRAAFDALQQTPLPTRGDKPTKLAFIVAAYNNATPPVLLARGSASLDLLVYHLVGRHDLKDPTMPEMVVASAPVSGTLQEKVVIDVGQIDKFNVGFQNLASMPAGTDRLRIFWRME